MHRIGRQRKKRPRNSTTGGQIAPETRLSQRPTFAELGWLRPGQSRANGHIAPDPRDPKICLKVFLEPLNRHKKNCKGVADTAKATSAICEKPLSKLQSGSFQNLVERESLAQGVRRRRKVRPSQPPTESGRLGAQPIECFYSIGGAGTTCD